MQLFGHSLSAVGCYRMSSRDACGTAVVLVSARLAESMKVTFCVRSQSELQAQWISILSNGDARANCALDLIKVTFHDPPQWNPSFPE